MYKRLITVFFICFLSGNMIGQNQKEDLLFKLIQSFSNLSYEDVKFEISYIKEKNTLYFKKFKSHKLDKAYRLLLVDIHPKGVFIYGNEGENMIRILSINNGNVFIEEKFTNSGFRISKTTNYIDIGYWNEESVNLLSDFIINLENFINSGLMKKIVNPKEIEILVAPTKRKNND